jgi:molybdopterin-guanine dinucleotide biosynthesis protein A
LSARVAAVILAGGRGERLGGVVKANLVVGGTRLLERVAGAIEPVDAVLIAHGAAAPEALYLMPWQTPVPDLDTGYAGPLAGLAGAVAWCTTNEEPPDILVTAAVDTPFLPKHFAALMVEALGDGSALVARHGGQDYPTNAAWRLSAIAGLPERLRAGTAPHSLRKLAAELSAGVLDWPESHGGDPFANANTPAELAALEARATAR